MLRISLFGVLLLILAGCAITPPTPVEVIQYPATWTPGPTATATPVPPTATRVIQNTSTPRPTSTTRVLPSPGRGRIGVWLDTIGLDAEILKELAQGAHIVTGPQALAAKQANRRATALLRVPASPGGDPFRVLNELDPAWDGLLLENVSTSLQAPQLSAALFASLRQKLGPRWLVVGADAWLDDKALDAASSNLTALLKNVNGVCLCDFMRAAEDGLEKFRDPASWKADVDALAALSSATERIVLVRVPFARVTPDEQRQLAAWLDYALASFLLGVNNLHGFFGMQGPEAAAEMDRPVFDQALGLPMGTYYQTFGVYQRRFERGLVVVNPSSVERTLPLPQVLRTRNGQDADRIVLSPHQGQILLRGE